MAPDREASPAEDVDQQPTEEKQERPRLSPATKFVLFVVTLVLVAAGGYLGFRIYARFDLPTSTGVVFYALAAGAGVAAFFSPCSFGLLLALLARRAGTHPDAPRAQRMGRAFTFAASMAVGATIFVVGLGLLIALGAERFTEAFEHGSPIERAVHIGIGLLLVALALIQLGILRINFGPVTRLAKPFARRDFLDRHPVAGYGVFGFGYLLAGFG